MLVINGTIITWENPNRILENHAMLVRNGKIVEIGPKETLFQRYPDEERFDAKNHYVMPGNLCSHTHFYGAFSRGLAIPGSAPADFPEKLTKLWWPLDRSLNLEDVRYSALVCLVDAVRHGTTTLIDHHASPDFIEGSLEEIAQAVDQAGIRASLCYEVTDRNGPKGTEAGIKENLRHIKSIKSGHSLNGRLAAMFGLHANLTLSEKTLEACRNACPDEVGFHVHVAEHPVDEYDSLEKSGLRAVDRLNKHGMLGPNSLVVHAVHVDVAEIELLAKTSTWVSHQPRSNMNNAVGLPMVESMLRAGIKVCLGNDGFSNAMWEEWKAAFLAHKLLNLDPRRMPAETVVEMAIYNNAQLVNQQFGITTGVLRPGAEADFITAEYYPFTPVTPGNLPWHMIFGFNESMIRDVVVAGKVLMKNRELLTMDEEKIAFHVQKLIPQVWRRFGEKFNEGIYHG
jgi:putative selenium metabolism protein SsnA